MAYKDAMRMLLRIPQYMSASQMFAELRVPAYQVVCRNLMFKFITRLDRSENSIISYLVSPPRVTLGIVLKKLGTLAQTTVCEP